MKETVHIETTIIDPILDEDEVDLEVVEPIVPLKPKRTPKAHQFDLISLEKALDDAYNEFRKDENEDTRTDLFNAVKSLSYAVLKVSNYIKKTNMDLEQVAYDYSMYLFLRLLDGSFRPQYDDKMPWQKYIDLNLRHTVFGKKDGDKWIELVEDLEFLVSTTGQHTLVDPGEEMHKTMDKDKLAKNLYEGLLIYFTDDEIKRLLPISTNLMYSNPKYYVTDDTPKDISDFTVVMIALAKRLVVQEVGTYGHDISKTNLSKMLASAMRSTVFLASVVNSDFFPKEFLLSLDIDSLYRLVQIAGGKKIRVPTSRELNTLVGSVVAASKRILEGKDIKDSVNEAKRDYDLVFSHQVNIYNFVSKVVGSVDLLGEDKLSDPMLNLLVLSIDTIEKLMDNYMKKLEHSDPATTMKAYEAFSQTVNTFTSSLLDMSEKIDDKKKSL